MITENSLSDNNGKNNQPENATPQQSDMDTQKSIEQPPAEKVLSEVDENKDAMLSEEINTETAAETENGEASENNSEEKTPETAETNLQSETEATKVESEEEEHEEESHSELSELSLSDILKKMESIINQENAGSLFRIFNQLRDQANHLIKDETEDKKHEFVAAGNEEENFSFEHPESSKLSGFIHIFREKNDEFHKQQEEAQEKNKEERQNIIEKLKSLYTNTEAGTNLFKAIREIKEEWKNAGQVAKSEFKLLNNNYFHHLNQFYAMLDLNKEYMEQEYAHNLETRLHIIQRAKELENEPVVQKALNELQYLHKLWKEEGEPVAEEHREKTWDEFKEISNKIHDRKAELSAHLEAEQNVNLEKKNSIIAAIQQLTSPEKEPNHSYWQNSIKKVEELRSEFLKLGSVPRKISNQNWTDFKQTLRNFNSSKNEFYKGLKNTQHSNLEAKQKLIQTAKDNMHSEDWETAVPLFKKLQEDWKKIGHVPRNVANKVWDEFREACNTFFNNFREKNNATSDNWKDNYKNKKQLLDELKEISEENGSPERIEEIKTGWNNIGKVPRDKMSINSEFNKTLREKLRLFKMNEYDLKDEGLSESQLTDKARKMKNQIADLEAEIVKLENNLGFFSNSSRENPLLKDTFDKIDEKKAQLESMKNNLHHIISGEA